MKKFFTFAVAAITLLSVSCNKESFPEAGNTTATIARTFTVTAPQSTKTELDGVKVIWSAGDEINVIATTTGNQYTFSITEGIGTASAKFSGSIAEADASETLFYALYPNVPVRAEETDTKGNRWALDQGQLVIDEPVLSQEAIEEGFPTAAAFLTAVSDADGNFAFRHGAAYFKLQIAEEGIESIHFEVSGSARLGGRPIYTMSTGATFQVNGAKPYMDFSCSGGFKKGSTYYLPVLTKQSDCGSLTLTFNAAGAKTATAVTSSLNKVKLTSGKIYDLGCPAIDFSPVIVADDVALEASATSGSIAYEITNATSDGVLSASLKEACDWLSVGTVSDDAVSLTATANESYARSAVVVLTYTYDRALTVSKEITVSQAAGASAGESHTHVFYYDSSSTAVNLTDGQAGSYFTATGKADLGGDYKITEWSINGYTSKKGVKFNSSGKVTFKTSATLNSSVQFWFIRRKSDATSAKIRIIADGAETPLAIFDTPYDEIGNSGIVTLEKNTGYTIQQAASEQALLLVIVTETE